MDTKRLAQWLIPFLFGMSIGMLILWNVDLWFPADAVVRYAASLVGIGALIAAVLIKMRTGYGWPWESAAEWSDRQVGLARFRRTLLWIVVVLLLLALFVFFQSR